MTISNPNRELPKHVGQVRDKATVQRLAMYKSGKPTRDRDGKIVKAADFQRTSVSGTMARVQPDRRYVDSARDSLTTHSPAYLRTYSLTHCNIVFQYEYKYKHTHTHSLI